MNPVEPLDAAMLTAELLSDPLHVAALLILAPPAAAGPGYVDELFQQGLAVTAEMDPRFRRYPHIGLDTAGFWMWRTDDSVDMRDHLERRTLPAGADRDALWKLVSELHSEPLALSRPMWIAYLIDGLEDGRFALYIKVHHTVIDGVAGLQMIGQALSTDPECRDAPPFYAVQRSPDGESGRHGMLPNPLALAHEALKGVCSGLGFVRELAMGEISTAVASIGAGVTVLPFGAPYTRFNGRLGRERAFAGVSLPKSRIAAIGDAAGVTVNDVLTAVVAGVLREWLTALGELPDKSLVAICPITVRARDGQERSADERRANLFGLELCSLGTHLTDDADRLAHIHRAMDWAKAEVARRGANVTTLLLAPSIGPTVLSPLMPFAPRRRSGYNVSISHVPGPKSEMYWNGAHLEEIYPVSTAINGQALNVTTCSYADRVMFGYISGRRVMPDIESVVPL
ncbi:MAG: wax ester/triacylglycerol synthase family O-acyltransferase, partial [Actinobacteria bacterium]|nr:wax ester/triacylglycerol synthase family O-acyltransferase [Actinomycetota bacterium]